MIGPIISQGSRIGFAETKYVINPKTEIGIIKAKEGRPEQSYSRALQTGWGRLVSNINPWAGLAVNVSAVRRS